MQKFIKPLLILVALLTLVAYTSIYIVPEGKQAVVKQFGRIVGVNQEPGLKVKLPYPFQEVIILEKRIINWDGRPARIPTRDGKNIFVDTTARWRITDPILFVETLGDESVAAERLTRLLDAATREVIRGSNRIETIRNSNAILDEISRLQAQREALRQNEDVDLLALAEFEEELTTGDVERISVGREELSRKIVERASEGLDILGIRLIDLQLRRVSSEEREEEQVYERMVTERQRIAQEIRSAGRGEQARIAGETDRMLKEIESEAYKKVQELRGAADAEAIRIYANAIGSDEDLYEFLRTLEMYRKALREDSKYILSSDSDFFKLLKEGPGYQKTR
jgi:membrane protease subunit HflC